MPRTSSSKGREKHLNVLGLCLGLALALGSVAAPMTAMPAQAQGAAVDAETELSRRAHQYSDGVMSPFCKGRTLNDCPSPDAGVLRERIKGWMRLGMSDKAIMDELVRSYGSGVIAVPRNTTEWMMPTVLLLAGLAVAAFAIRRVTRRKFERQHVAIPRELEKRLDAELRSHGF
jgi:cytochrome c-type biogenesis protein CcmH/NrfF